MTQIPVTSARFERPIGGVLGGVALGLARATGTSPVLWRVLFVVLTFFGGLGAALYLVCWVAMPAEGEERSLGARLLHGPDRQLVGNQLLLVILLVLAVIGVLRDSRGLVGALVLLGMFLLWRRDREAGHVLVPPAARPASPPTVAPPSSVSAAPPVSAPAPAQAPVARRTPLTGLTLSAASVVVGTLLLVASVGAVSVPTEVVLAAALGVVGVGLVVSAWWGRARGLVPVALLLALALGGAVAVRPALEHGVGQRTWAAAAAGDYRLGIGDATLLLPSALGAEGGTVRARVTLGHLVVVVPPGLHVVVDARVRNGDLRAPGLEDNGRGVHHRIELGPPGAPAVQVAAEVDAGLLEVRRG